MITVMTTPTVTPMIRTVALAGLLTLGLVGSANAITIEPCDWRASLQGIPEPWADHSRTYASGDVRVTVTDMIEPGAAPYHLVVISPPYDELGARQCRVVSLDSNLGFARMVLVSAQSSYDPASGLTLTIPSGLPDEATGGIRERDLAVTINQATADITAQWADAD